MRGCEIEPAPVWRSHLASAEATLDLGSRDGVLTQRTSVRAAETVQKRRRWAALAAPLLATLALVAAACGPPASVCVSRGKLSVPPASTMERPIEQTSPAVAALAKRYQPTVVMSELDRFWPVSVSTVLNERDRDGVSVRLVSGRNVVADPTLADLRPSDVNSAYLDYPANLGDKAAQMRVFLRGLGVPESIIDSWPAHFSALASIADRSAQIYFYDAGTGCSYGGRDTKGYRALEYWFFYGFNYYPMTVDTPTMLDQPLSADTADVDLHEGDWEHVAVLLDREGSGYAPKFIWMARHASEGVLIPWDQVERDSTGNPVVYPAFGGHPSYPACGAHARPLLAAAVYDYVVCRPDLYTFSAATTRLVDLTAVSWSCWPGHFGTTVGTAGTSNADDPTGQILVAGPGSPLQQGENRGVCLKSSG